MKREVCLWFESFIAVLVPIFDMIITTVNKTRQAVIAINSIFAFMWAQHPITSMHSFSQYFICGFDLCSCLVPLLRYHFFFFVQSFSLIRNCIFYWTFTSHPYVSIYLMKWQKMTHFVYCLLLLNLPFITIPHIGYSFKYLFH